MIDMTSRDGLRGLEPFFNPRSVAVIGATDKDGAAGRTVLENLLQSGSKRKIFPINPHYKELLSTKCYPDIGAIPEVPDLAVIVTPAETVPGLVENCGKVGVSAITIISAGFKEIGEEGEARENKIAEIARQYQIRIMGPNCMGTIRPSSALNTTLIRRMPQTGYVAFLSQSGALGTGILDWAIRRNIGFSAFVSLGSMLDVDFGDAIDYFGEDPETHSIIIYPESLGKVKGFVSAARGFARSKPIIVLKPGKFVESAKAVRSHTGSMVGEDMHYDAIFRRAGVVRVEEMRDLFNCASILDSAKLPWGPNVAIITNGGGPAVLAIDNLISRGGKLAALNDETMATLNKFLPPNWSRANPIDIREDADVQRYKYAIEAAVGDPAVNGILVIYTPQGKAGSEELAQEVIKLAKQTSKPMLGVWIGGELVASGRQLFAESKVPVFEFPEEAVTTYLYMWQYARNLGMLYQTPEESPMAEASRNHLKSVLHKAMLERRIQLTDEDASRFLSTYRIPTTMPYTARNPEEAASLATFYRAGAGGPVHRGFLVFSVLSLSVAGGAAVCLAGRAGPDGARAAAAGAGRVGAAGPARQRAGRGAGHGAGALALRLLGGDLGGGYFPGVAPRCSGARPRRWCYGALGVVGGPGGRLVAGARRGAMAPAQALKGLGAARTASRRSHGSAWF